MTKLLHLNPDSSTNWRTEALLIAVAVLTLAGIDAVAQKYGLTALQGTAADLAKLGLTLLAAATARARGNAKLEAQAQVGGSAGA